MSDIADDLSEEWTEKADRIEREEIRRAQLYFNGADRPYWPPRRHQGRLEFSESEVRGCFEALGEEWQTERFERAYRLYKSETSDPWLVRVFLLSYLLVVVMGSALAPGPVVLKVSIGAAILIFVSHYAYKGLHRTLYSRAKFYREILAAERSIANMVPMNRNEMIAAAIGHAGYAARELFRFLRGGRWTWTTPPAVADRAVTLSFPIIDVNVADEHNMIRGLFLHMYPRFLHDVAGLVMMGRPDLIPALRRGYPFLFHRLEEGQYGQPTDRDIRYLDPMRDHDRGQVFREFILPLSSWLSFLVAAIALVVALLK